MMPLAPGTKTPLIFVQERTRQGQTLYQVMDYTRRGAARFVDTFTTQVEAEALVVALAETH